MIFQMYKEVFSRDPELFSGAKSFGLSPLSVVMADLFDEMSFDDRMRCLEMLGAHSIDNYTEDFISKLYEAYSQESQVQSLMDEGIDDFVHLADVWPKFLQNNVLLTKLSTIPAQNFSMEDQSRILKIQTHKNLLNP